MGAKLLSNKSGYSLVTLAVLVAVFSAVTVGLITQVTQKDTITKKVQDLDGMNTTLQYVQNYGTANLIIPCPADPTLPATDANYLRASGTYPACNTTLPNKSGIYFKGLLPTRTIGINDSYAFDKNNSLLTYMVSKDTNYFKVNIDETCIYKDGTLNGSCNYLTGTQFLQFAAGNEPNVVLISHGPNQIGAFKKDRTSASTFLKSDHQISAKVLANGKTFDSVPQSINHDLYISGNMDEIVFKPVAPIGNPNTTSTSRANYSYDDIVVFSRITTAQVGDVQCWGNSGEGGTAPSSPVIKASDLYAVSQAVCAVKADKTIQCWGQAGGSAPSFTASELPLKSVAIARYSFCAIKNNGLLKCWGDSDTGGDRTDLSIKFLSSYKNLGATCGIDADNKVTCWGNSAKGGSTPSNVEAKSLAGTTQAMCAIKTDDTVQCWGNSSYGGSTPSGPISAKSIVGGNSAMCAIKTNDLVQCWGVSGEGGTTPVPGMSAKALFGGTRVMCAIKTNDEVACWGDGSYGANAPANTKVKSLAISERAVCAIKFDDNVECWGDVTYGGYVASFAAKAISASWNAMCAIKLDDTVQCWGNSGYGGTTPSGPIKAMSLVSTGTAMCAIKK